VGGGGDLYHVARNHTERHTEDLWSNAVFTGFSRGKADSWEVAPGDDVDVVFGKGRGQRGLTMVEYGL